MRNTDKIKVGILGCTGLVGQQFIRMLEDHPYFEVASLSSSQRSNGQKYGKIADWSVEGEMPDNVKDIVLTDVSSEDLKKKEVKILFSALPSNVAERIEKNLAEDNFAVFSNAGAFRMEPFVPILIPEINPEHLELVRPPLSGNRGFIVTNSNCSTTGFVFGLKPLLPYGLRSAMVTTYQALSGAGRNGISAMDILGNVIPFISSEEEKMEKETQKILGRVENQAIKHNNLEVNASCCRVPTRFGHLESIVVEMDEGPDMDTIKKAFSGFRGVPQEMGLPSAPVHPIILREEENRPQPFVDHNAGSPSRARGMAVTVGRFRKKGNKLNFFLLVHNLIRGAAGTCILNAELAVKTKIIV